MAADKPTACIVCHGRLHDEGAELVEAYFHEPHPEFGDVRLQGYMCEECVTVHWAAFA